MINFQFKVKQLQVFINKKVLIILQLIHHKLAIRILNKKLKF